MNRHSRLFATALLVFLSAGPALAQEPPPRFQGGIGFASATPLDDFADNVNWAGGVLGHFDVALGRSIFSTGGELSYLSYGSETRTVPLGPLVPEIPGAAINVDTTNAMFIAHARLRVQPRTGRWRPYADGLFGLTDLFTTSSISGPQACSGGFLSGGTCVPTDYASNTNSRDVVLSYGGGGGVMINFTSSPTAARLDIAGRYVSGGRATYLTPGAIHHEEGVATFDFVRSRTDFFSFYIGVAFGR